MSRKTGSQHVALLLGTSWVLWASGCSDTAGTGGAAGTGGSARCGEGHTCVPDPGRNGWDRSQ